MRDEGGVGKGDKEDRATADTQTLTIPALTCARCQARIGEGACALCGYVAPDPRVGLFVADKYYIEALIGAGGTGRVYRAMHLELGSHVAVKFLQRHWASEAEIRARFRREAIALARFRHPGVVSILDFGELGGEPYMVMELVKGTTLGGVLANGELPLPRIVDLFALVLQVVEAAHAAGIVHRDLKPENVMVLDNGDRTPRIKVLDFGLARVSQSDALKRLTETGMVHGTPHYMSPEQCRGRDVTSATDVYALGVMLFEALAGGLPFDAPDVVQVMTQHIFVEPPRIGERATRAVPPALERLVQRAMAKRPEARPTASEMRDVLAAIMAGTDDETLSDRAAHERARMAALSRGERAFTGVHEEPVITAAAGTDGAKVAVWVLAMERATHLRDVLAVNGYAPLIWSGAEPGSEAVSAVIVLSEPDGVARTAALRRGAATKDVPILVLDAVDAMQTAALIRAGASDVALASSADADISRKIVRLLRRRR